MQDRGIPSVLVVLYKAIKSIWHMINSFKSIFVNENIW